MGTCEPSSTTIEPAAVVNTEGLDHILMYDDSDCRFTQEELGGLTFWRKVWTGLEHHIPQFTNTNEACPIISYTLVPPEGSDETAFTSTDGLSQAALLYGLEYPDVLEPDEDLVVRIVLS